MELKICTAIVIRVEKMKIKYFYIVTYYSLFLLIFLITSGCESQLHQEQSRVKEFHQEAQLVETQQTLLRWFYWVESKPMQLAKTYQNHTELFSLPTLQLVDKIFQQTKQPEQITELRAFKNYLQNEYINREIAAKEDTIRSIRSSAQFAFNGKNYVLKDVKQLLSGSLSKEEADKLFETILPKLQKLSSLRMSIDRQRTEVAQTLEFPSHIELASSIYYFSPTHIHQHAIELLSQTNSLYRSLL
ncbi:MAG: hypothetical protein GWN59_00555, partial [Calditrichae bacterium]|nr:hypothetical protein [Calditrichia bacterium]NIV71277.1 hypothetical protein [Calditrichia bacterium]